MCPQSLMTRTPRSTAGPSHTFAGKSENKRLRFRRTNDNGAVVVTVAVTIITSVIAIQVVIVRRCPQQPQVWRCAQRLMARTPRSTDSPSHTFAGKSENKRLISRRANDNDAVVVTVAVTFLPMLLFIARSGLKNAL